ncbi:MAG: ester cyclase [Chloroflexi bacterium]|nr:ester cyclase [Chloroflexota bacterium]
MSEANKALARRFYDEVLNAGRLDVLDEILTADAVYHNAALGEPAGREGAKARIAGLRTGFPDLHYTVEQFVAEGGTVAARFVIHGTHDGPFGGIAATGRKVQITGSAFYQMADGKITEVRVFADFLNVIQQIGAVITPPVGE